MTTNPMEGAIAAADTDAMKYAHRAATALSEYSTLSPSEGQVSAILALAAELRALRYGIIHELWALRVVPPEPPTTEERPRGKGGW